MLSDAEQRRLAQIELALWVEDPAFVRRFGTGGRQPGRRRRLIAWLGWLVLAAVAAFAGALIGGGLVAGALGAAVLVCGVGGWAVVCRRSGKGRPPTSRQ